MFVARAHCSFILSKSPGFFVGITKHSSSPSSSAPRRRQGVRRPPLQVEAGGQANDAAANDADAHDGAALKFLGESVLFRNLFRDWISLSDDGKEEPVCRTREGKMEDLANDR